MRDHLATILASASAVSTGGFLALAHDPVVHQALGAALSALVSWSVVRMLDWQRKRFSPAAEKELEHVEREVGAALEPIVEAYGRHAVAALADKIAARLAAPKAGPK